MFSHLLIYLPHFASCYSDLVSLCIVHTEYMDFIYHVLINLLYLVIEENLRAFIVLSFPNPMGISNFERLIYINKTAIINFCQILLLEQIWIQESVVSVCLATVGVGHVAVGTAFWANQPPHLGLVHLPLHLVHIDAHAHVHIKVHVWVEVDAHVSVRIQVHIHGSRHHAGIHVDERAKDFVAGRDQRTVVCQVAAADPELVGVELAGHVVDVVSTVGIDIIKVVSLDVYVEVVVPHKACRAPRH